MALLFAIFGIAVSYYFFQAAFGPQRANGPRRSRQGFFSKRSTENTERSPSAHFYGDSRDAETLEGLTNEERVKEVKSLQQLWELEPVEEWNFEPTEGLQQEGPNDAINSTIQTVEEKENPKDD